MRASRSDATSAIRIVLLVAAALGALVALIVLGRAAGAHLAAFSQRVNGLGLWAPIVFIAGYALAAVAFVPGSILTLAAGALFGIVRGTIYVMAGATLGASAAFLISRYAARSFVERRLAGNSRFVAIDRAVGAEGRTIVFLLRLSPLVPFNVLNYALGLTRVRFVDYLAASIGMLPATVLYVYYGKLAGDVAALAGGAPHRGVAYYATIAVGLAATVVAATVITKRARSALSDRTAGRVENAPNA